MLTSCLVIDLAVCAVLGRGAVWWFYAVTVLPLALLVPWLVGRYQQARRALVSDGWRLALSLEEQQRFVAEQARLRERTRIAADMHDSLGHVLSLIALRAGALELSPTLSEQDRDDVAELRQAVSEAVDHLRETVTVLRDGRDDTDPRIPPSSPWKSSWTGRALPALRWTWSGRAAVPPCPPRRARRVPGGAGITDERDQTRPGSAVHVRIAHEGGRTEVAVTNSASPAGRCPAWCRGTGVWPGCGRG
ncbi:histidine kinase dimerization/phosphoacceptor domain-containing protein [Streptomyces sp. M10(2022)]